jgi:DNA repair protein SbcC/Rad50
LVPVKILLKNFMCYKDAELDLEGIRLACLSGDNGAGKSAVFDAMTWAVWGKARASQDELMNSQETQMQVDFQFDLGFERYRVIRRRVRKSSSIAELEFQVSNMEGGWRSLRGSTMSETQRDINDKLRMDYDTFVNSAFLRQGKADEFTVKTPTERKRVLADILQLDYFDKLEEQARDRAKEADTERKRINEKLDEINEQLKTRPSIIEQKNRAEADLANGNAILKNNESEVARLQTAVDTLTAKENLRKTVARRLEVARQELQQSQSRLAQTTVKIELCEEFIANRTVIERGYNDYLVVEKDYDAMTKKFHRYGQLMERRRELQNQIDKKRNSLEVEQRYSERQIEESTRLSQNLPTLEKDLEKLRQDLQNAANAAEQIEQLKEERQTLIADGRILAADIKRNEDLLKEIGEKGKQIPPAGEHCDRCGQVLSEEAHKKVLAERRQEWADLKASIKEQKNGQDEAKLKVEALEKRVRELEVPAKKAAELQKRSGSLENELATARQAGEKVVAATEKLRQTLALLESGDFSKAERQELEQVDKESRELAFDQSALQRLKEKLDGLKKFQKDKESLDTALANIEGLRQDALAERATQKRLQTEIAEGDAQVATLAQEVASLNDLTGQLTTAKVTLENARTNAKSYQQRLWQAENELKRLDEREDEKKRRMEELTIVGQNKAIYDDLALAFGKKGMQALIIETILPELEYEANRLLSNMTDGRMSIRFETQGSTRKGDPVETLELKISDENGVRNYELFSGGEAFRVNFAVRVALSKLLARRAGAALRTLIVDEGFGTQDGSGRERLVEAIRSIEDEFDRILVITHIQELKDAFPTRIDVARTSNGSTISVNAN